jgi:hypothetical protein
MKQPPDNPEFARFTAAMRTIVKVSKTELNRRIEETKKGKRSKSLFTIFIPEISGDSRQLYAAGPAGQ